MNHTTAANPHPQYALATALATEITNRTNGDTSTLNSAKSYTDTAKAELLTSINGISIPPAQDISGKYDKTGGLISGPVTIQSGGNTVDTNANILRLRAGNDKEVSIGTEYEPYSASYSVEAPTNVRAKHTFLQKTTNGSITSFRPADLIVGSLFTGLFDAPSNVEYGIAELTNGLIIQWEIVS